MIAALAWSPVVRERSRISSASPRTLASVALYSSRRRCASARVSSAASMLPWMSARRSSMILWMGPKANFQRMNRAMPNVMSVQTMRPHSVFSMTSSVLPCGRSLQSRHEDQDEGDDEGVQRHGLGHADTDEHVGADIARHFRLPGDALERLADPVSYTHLTLPTIYSV